MRGMGRLLKADFFRVYGLQFWAVAIVGAVLKAVDCYFAPMPFGAVTYAKMGFSLSAVYCLDNEDGGTLLSHALVGLCALSAAGLFAEEAQSGAHTMRLHRTGRARYAASRTVHAGMSAFLCMALIDFFAMCLLVLIFKQAWLYGDSGINEWHTSRLLASGKIGIYAVLMVAKQGLEAAFYAVLTVGVSAFLVNRRALVAVPVILRYVFTYCIIFPGKAQPWSPHFIYENGWNMAALLGLGDMPMFIAVCAYTAIAALIGGVLLYVRVRD